MSLTYHYAPENLRFHTISNRFFLKYCGFGPATSGSWHGRNSQPCKKHHGSLISKDAADCQSSSMVYSQPKPKVHYRTHFLHEDSLRIKLLPISYDVITSTGQFMCDCLYCHHTIGLGYLSLIIPSYVLIMPQSMVRCLHICP